MGTRGDRDLIRSRIKVKSLNFMRGRTFINKYLIIDEAQNLTPKQMKTLITRAGPVPKWWCSQHRADRHPLPDRRQLRPDLRGRPLQGLVAQRARHAAARRALAPRRLRGGSSLTSPKYQNLRISQNEIYSCSARHYQEAAGRVCGPFSGIARSAAQVVQVSPPDRFRVVRGVALGFPRRDQVGKLTVFDIAAINSANRCDSLQTGAGFISARADARGIRQGKWKEN